jgi:LCP family protein required for cell wall assembly
MNEKQRKRKRTLRILVIALVIIALLAAGLYGVRFWENRQTSANSTSTEQSEEDDVQKIRYNGKWYRLKENVQTVLVIGLDKFEDQVSDSSYSNDQQSDFLMLLIIDDKDKTCTALQINRDAMADVPVLDITGDEIDTVNEQLALAHTYGSGSHDSCRNTVSAVSSFLYNTPIDHYISLTMDAVETLNDLVDGVTVTVLDDFSGVDDTLKKGEEVTLLGEHALNYVRSRYGLEDSTNAQRMIRQRQYMSALYKKILQYSDNDDSFVVDATLKINNYMVSDCSISQLQTFANDAISYEIGDIQTIKGESVKGEKYMEFYPDEDALQEQIVQLLYECVE